MIIENQFGYNIVVFNTERNTALGYIKPVGRDFQKEEKNWLEENLNITYNDTLVLGIDSGKLSDTLDRADFNKNSVFYVLQAAANQLYNIFQV